jgi:hypothetical protein
MYKQIQGDLSMKKLTFFFLFIFFGINVYSQTQLIKDLIEANEYLPMMYEKNLRLDKIMLDNNKIVFYFTSFLQTKRLLLEMKEKYDILPEIFPEGSSEIMPLGYAVDYNKNISVDDYLKLLSEIHKTNFIKLYKSRLIDMYEYGLPIKYIFNDINGVYLYDFIIERNEL